MEGGRGTCDVCKDDLGSYSHWHTDCQGEHGEVLGDPAVSRHIAEVASLRDENKAQITISSLAQ